MNNFILNKFIGKNNNFLIIIYKKKTRPIHFSSTNPNISFLKNDLTLFIQILLTKIYFGSMSFQFIKKCRIVKGSDGRWSKFCGKLKSRIDSKKN